MAKKTRNTLVKPVKTASKVGPEKASATDHNKEDPVHSKLDSALQQKVLDIFSRTFENVISSDNFQTTLQDIKTALYSRDFVTAFKDDHLEAYAARWSPTRALGYAQVLNGLQDHLEGLFHTTSQAEDDQAKRRMQLPVICLGGGAAEAVAFGTFVGQLSDDIVHLDLTLMDSAPWDKVVEKLHCALKTPPPLSKYASAEKVAQNAALVPPGRMQDVAFKRQDVLQMTDKQIAAQIPSDHDQRQPVIVTLLFTLNELFTAGGIGKTTKLLLGLTHALAQGSMLLVVDSPGDYSEVAVGQDLRRWPTSWLLNKILLETGIWQSVISDESRWFRLAKGLSYPLPLEDMRYQLHLYRLSDSSPAGESSAG